MTSRIISDDVTKIMIFCQILSKNEDNPQEPPYNPIFIFFASECKLALSSPPNSETVIENHFFLFFQLVFPADVTKNKKIYQGKSRKWRHMTSSTRIYSKISGNVFLTIIFFLWKNESIKAIQNDFMSKSVFSTFTIEIYRKLTPAL